jgi:hypothetical protein
MVIGNEADAQKTCMDCQHSLITQVLHSNAGYYLGTECPNCGPVGRESEYIPFKEDAENILVLWNVSPAKRLASPWRRTKGFQG